MLLVSAMFGIGAGVFTGLVPGIHPNTVIFMAVPVYFSTSVPTMPFVAVLTGMSVSHTFHDFLPALFISAPDAESALSSLSASEMVQSGRGLEAFQYTVYGGIFSVLPVVMVSLLSLMYLQELYSFISGFMGFILLFFLVFMVLDSEEVFRSLMVAVFAGALGVASFRSGVNQSFVFIPVFSGLFAVPAMLSSLRSGYEIPEQSGNKLDRVGAFKGGLAGTAAGFLAGVIPGIGAAVSTSFLSPLIENSREKFLSSMGAVNTTDIVFSLVALSLLGRSRSGVSVALEMMSAQVDMRQVVLLSFACIFISAPLALKISGHYVNLLRSLDISQVFLIVLGILVSVIFIFTGFNGLLIFFTASVIGQAGLEAGNRKVCMAVLIVPAILFFTGITIFM